jgi:KDO2-lipid IV(A) lauroyltransferase
VAIGLGLSLPFGWLVAWLPARLGLWVGRRLGDLAWAGLPRRRAVTLENLTSALGTEHATPELRRLCRLCFEHLGMNVVEACVFLFRPPGVLLSRVDLRGVEHLRAAGSQGKGVLFLTAHYGNWELLGASHVLTGFPLSVVVRPLDDPVLGRVVARLRERAGVEQIAKRRGLREVLEALRRGRTVGVLLDQNASRAEGVFVPFFGLPASTSKALALISLRSGAPVVPAFIRRQRDGRHRVEIEPALPVPPDGDVVAYTATFTLAIEAAARRAPEQWFWMHRRWKTRPAPAPA